MLLPDVKNSWRLRQSQVVILFVGSGRHAGNANWFHLIVWHTETLSRSVIDYAEMLNAFVELRRWTEKARETEL